MGNPMTTPAWRKLVREDREWLDLQEPSLEKDHIDMILAVCEKSTTRQFEEFYAAVEAGRDG